jgi:hypothetical protein
MRGNAERRDHPAVGDLCLRLGPVAYRGIEALDGPSPMGHEYAGIVEQVGSQVST